MAAPAPMAAPPTTADPPTMVLRIPGVHLYQVVDMVHTYLCTDVLLCNAHNNGQGHVVNMVVGPHSWPLSPQIPVLRSDVNMYIFGVEGQQNFFFCVMLPPDVAPEASAALQALLPGVSNYQDHAQQAPQQPAVPVGPAGPPPSKLAQGILKGGQVVAAGVTFAAGLAAQGMVRASEYAISKSTPNATPTHIKPETQARLEKTRQVTSTTATVARNVSEGVIALSSQAAVAAASTLTGKGNGKPSTVKEVGVAGLLAFSSVWEAMWGAGKLVLEATKEHGSRVVEHKYGPEAAKASRSGMGVAVDVFKAVHALSAVRPSSIVKHTAKETCKRLLDNQNLAGSKNSMESQNSMVPHSG